MSSWTVTMCVPKINKTVRLAETVYDTPSPTEISSQDLASALPCLLRALPMFILDPIIVIPSEAPVLSNAKELSVPSLSSSTLVPRRLSSTLVVEDLIGDPVKERIQCLCLLSS